MARHRRSPRSCPVWRPRRRHTRQEHGTLPLPVPRPCPWRSRRLFRHVHGEPITQDDIESFKSLGVEVCLQLEAIGDVWLVPRYSQQDRREITPEHAATLRLLLEAFPGARIAAFEKTTSAKAAEAQA